MHSWGDKDFDWEGLNEAIILITKKLKFWRIPIRDYKEKFGTCRIYCSLGWSCLLDITHSGYISYRVYPEWLKKLDIYFLPKIIRYLNIIIIPIHKWAYKNAYKNAVKKYPHLKQEICCMADYVELLESFYKG